MLPFKGFIYTQCLQQDRVAIREFYNPLTCLYRSPARNWMYCCISYEVGRDKKQTAGAGGGVGRGCPVCRKLLAAHRGVRQDALTARVYPSGWQGERGGLLFGFFCWFSSFVERCWPYYTLPLASMALLSVEGLEDLNIACVLIKHSLFCSTEAHVDE